MLIGMILGAVLSELSFYFQHETARPPQDITLTIPADLLTELRALGMKRKAEKMKDTDTSALIREAVTDFLNKHRAN